MSDSTVAKYVLLRYLVGFLGEKDQFGWWDTSFLGPTGLTYCEINFPRSALAAAGASATEAARRLHDSRIGKGGIFHLFRLPPALEESVHRKMMQTDPDPVREMIGCKQTAQDALEEIAVEKLDAPEGPVQVGTVKTILYARSVEELAKHYFDAFLKGKVTFPYFMDRTK